MIPRYSFSMLGRNFDLMFKVLIYVFLLLLICVAVLVAIINPIFDSLNSNINLSDRLMQTLSELINSERENVLGELARDIAAVIQSISSEIYIAVILIITVLFITKFFFSLTAVPLGEVIYRRMSSNFSVMFHNVLVASLCRAVLFSLINTAVTLVADILIGTICYYLLILLYPAISAYAIVLTTFLFFLLIASRIALLGQWIPQIVCEKKRVAKAFRDSFKQSVKCFWKVMPVVFAAIVMAFSVLMTTAVLTFGLLPALIVPFLLILMTNLNLVAYFAYNKKKFYVDEVTIVNVMTEE